MSEHEERFAAQHRRSAARLQSEIRYGVRIPVPELIGRSLKSCYEEAPQQPLPRHLRELLEELDAKAAGHSLPGRG